VIEANALTFRYAPGERDILENVSLRIARGEYVSVVGENGCGKSTLIRLILGLLKPTSGSIECKAKRIGYVPQKKDFLGSQFPLTVREMLDSYRALVGVRDRGIVRANLERVGMDGYRDALVGTLSGGQAQRVFIARALTGDPDLIVLDEPSNGVDMKNQKEIYDVIKGLNRGGGITIVSVEHNLDAAVMNSTLIFHIANGNGHICNPHKYASEFLKGRVFRNV
jgi:zinc transport system ATP-binding protein